MGSDSDSEEPADAENTAADFAWADQDAGDAEPPRKALRCIVKTLLNNSDSAEHRAHLARRFAAALRGPGEKSRGCILLDGAADSALELLPGGARPFLRRAHRARGYTVLIWVRERKDCGPFEVVAVGKGATRVTITPVRRAEGGSSVWTREVFAGGRARGAASRDVDDSAFELGDDLDPDDDENLAARWRLLGVSHAARYLSQAEVQVTVDGLPLGGPAPAPIPSVDDAERDASAS
eukprot:CAMPEP_0119294108 /NCGR_PEP_ID=MMETSP1329-20130426/47289_1 /TAXON_ID=114041 /ORGANISM="Genus nov. species nov., Strain RCC1024" /LENGTH=236 /DNA_ID=CAMNT_0007294987 /DNA_START=116 /DNA_END=823 /DNA_ORIENTATION=-